MATTTIEDLLKEQEGVISRRQVRACGGTDNDIERRIRRREWARVFEGVYVHHTGPLSREQRAWAAVLLHWPAALAGSSALAAFGIDEGAETHDAVEIAVADDRRVDDPPGVITQRLKDFERVALMNLGPPRVRVEHAALTVAARAATDDGAVALLGNACQKHRTTAQRLSQALGSRRRLKRRQLLAAVLRDVAAGTNSALERRYLVDVERAHGLPVGRRQRRVVNGTITAYRDVDYGPTRTVVELDGRVGHDTTSDRWDDLDRDVASGVAGDLTVRVGWRQVLVPCRLAAAIAAVLVARGWRGEPTSCGPGCPLGTPEDVRRPAPAILR